MSTDDTTPCYVVTYGSGRHMEAVHGVFMDEDRAELACEELGRVYDAPDEWAEVKAHELVTELAHMANDD